MSVKDVKNYYKIVCDQYTDLNKEIKDFEEEASKGMMDPDALDRIKENMQPLMDNYQRISYIMFLLNKPNKKEKFVKYEKQNKKLLAQIDKKHTTDSTIEENKTVLNNVANIIQGE